MYCSFCGESIRDGAEFCSCCGKNQTNGKMKQVVPPLKGNSLFSNKKVIFSGIAVFLVVVITAICVSVSKANSIVGVWMDGTSKVTFTSDGDVSMDYYYGTYTIDNDKNLIMQSGEFSYYSGRREYKYGSDAKNDSDYWYISGGILYFEGGQYTKK